MVKPLRLLNLAANVGVKDEENFKEISESIEDYINVKVESELELDDILKNKLDEVMGAFRYTSHELFVKTRQKKFHDGLNGLQSFDFIFKCKEATNEIKRQLNDKAKPI